MPGFYQTVKDAKSEGLMRKIRALVCLTPSLEEGNGPRYMGGQWHFKTTLPPHSGILNQRSKFEDFEGKPLHGQWAWKQKETAGVKRHLSTYMEGFPGHGEFNRLLNLYTFLVIIGCEWNIQSNAFNLLMT